MSYLTAFRGTMIALVAVEAVLFWRGADVLVVAGLPLIVGLGLNVAVRLIPGWSEEASRIRQEPERLRRAARARRLVYFAFIPVILLVLAASMLGFGLGHR